MVTGPVRWHVTRVNGGPRLEVRKRECGSVFCNIGGRHYKTHKHALNEAIRIIESRPPRTQSDYALAQGGPTT